jgi:nucleoside-diphosphate-sugar epimerase
VETVLITGAGGLVGGVLRRGLAGRYEIRGIDRARRGDRDVSRVDVRHGRRLRRALQGVDAVVHLAAVAAADADWPTVVSNNLRGTVNVLEAAQAAGVRRLVYASSNHVTGLYEREQPYAAIVAGKYEGLRPDAIPRIGSDWPVRPDGPYGVDKVFGEAAARYYSDAFGLQAICLRIGSVLAADSPSQPRHFATLLTHADLVRLVGCALEAPPSVRFGVFYGVSANTWRFWDIEAAREAIGYEARDDAERFRAG